MSFFFLGWGARNLIVLGGFGGISFRTGPARLRGVFFFFWFFFELYLIDVKLGARKTAGFISAIAQTFWGLWVWQLPNGI